MNLFEVSDIKTRKEFLNVPRILYKNDPNWVCPLDVEIENIFNPNKNSCFKNGDAKRWILKDTNEKLIGRIAAFYDMRKSERNKQPTGGIGFFECVDNQDAANIMFDTAKQWLESKGMQAMDGPINFGENLFHWGLLVKGFVQQAYGMPFNFPYYKKLFETYGFKNYFEQYTFIYNTSKPFPERMTRFAQFITTKPEYVFKNYRNSDREKFLNDFISIFNKTWSEFMKNKYTPMVADDVRAVLKDAAPVIDEDLIWFVYKDGEPLGTSIIFPDMNQVLKYMNGKINLWSMMKFFWYKNIIKPSRVRVLVTGVIPEYQRTGVAVAIFYKVFVDTFRKKKHYKEIDFSWVGDYNPDMISMYKHIGGENDRTHITYRYLFDRNAEFERFTIN